MPSPLPTEAPVSIPISIPISSMNVTGIMQCSAVTNCPNGPSYGTTICTSNGISMTPCGYSCSLSNADNSFEYTFRGEKFQVYGTYGPTLGRYNIYVDGQLLIKINQQRSTEEKYAHQYTSDLLTYGDHTIRAIGVGDTFEIYKFTFWPSIKAIRVNFTEFTVVDNGWNCETDIFGGFRKYSNKENAIITLDISSDHI